jgi:hypothetical protein
MFSESDAPDPNDFYALLDEIEIAARDARGIGDSDRKAIIIKLQEIRRKSNDAKDENLIEWDSSLRDCLNKMGSPDERSETIRELLESATENVSALLKCLNQIEQATQVPGETAPAEASRGTQESTQESTQRPWWRRIIGG